MSAKKIQEAQDACRELRRALARAHHEETEPVVAGLLMEAWGRLEFVFDAIAEALERLDKAKGRTT